jgi:predicted  nucleic acid-binding Zn-ribbon protein
VKVVTVSVFKHFWRNLIKRFSPRVPWSPEEVEREFSVARQERQSLSGQLTDLRAELERGMSAVKQEQQSLLVQLDDLNARVEQDYAAAGSENKTLHGELTSLQLGVEHGMAAVRQEQQNLSGKLTSLQVDFEHELSAARQEKQELLGQLDDLRTDLERTRSRDEQLRAELQQRFEEIQSERDAANQELTTLRVSLADASARQNTTENRVNSLESRLRQQQQEHDAGLQQTLIRERRLARRLTAAMTVAIAAFVLGIVGSAINFWEVKNTARLLAEVSQGIRDIQTSMDGHLSMGVPLMPALSASPTTEESTSPATRGSTPAGTGETSPRPGDTGRGLPGQKLPEPDFVVSKTLPLNGHDIRSRQDAQAFFEENAKQPGVITLPSGLQYRELIRGTGKIPDSGDKVVVEYRAFRPDGTETDNSFKADLPTSITVNEAIPALKEALSHMEEGAQWELYVPANLAYPGIRKRGSFGFEPLIMTVELISVVPEKPAR